MVGEGKKVGESKGRLCVVCRVGEEDCFEVGGQLLLLHVAVPTRKEFFRVSCVLMIGQGGGLHAGRV